MLRISLIVAIVLGLATLGVSQLKTDKFIKETKATLASTEAELTSTKSSLATSKRNERAAVQAAEEAKKELEDTKFALEESTAKAVQQERRANENETKLEDTTRIKNEVEAKLGEWLVFGVTPQRVREVLDENKRMTEDMTAVNKENQVLDREVIRLKNRLLVYEGEKVKVDLPPGLKGQVLAVDPRYEFVVLNIGEEDGVLERGEMLVNRGGKLVAKVRIVSVQPKRAVANVLPDWKQADVMEGDAVLVGL